MPAISDNNSKNNGDGNDMDKYGGIKEGRLDLIAAWISILYTNGLLLCLSWLVFWIWSGKYVEQLNRHFAVSLSDYKLAAFRLIAYTAIGGGIGAAVNNIRTFLKWHADKQSFNRRCVWNYVALPVQGAVLAVIVCAIIQSGVTTLSGINNTGIGAVNSLTAWAIGSLAGYGSRDVSIWLDQKVSSLFQVPAKLEKVPDLIGSTRDDAKKQLSSLGFEVKFSEKETTNEGDMERVIEQSPAAETSIEMRKIVDVTIGKRGSGDNPGATSGSV